MSDRLATECEFIVDQLQDLYEETADDEQQNRLLSAIHTLEEVAEVDREQHGATPEDKLAQLIEESDGCLHCEEPDIDGGWCDMECMRAYFDEQEATADA